ncbi:MAG: acetyl-CoA carboxylase, carboxyltransferase subunit beta [Bacillota bacterium]
MLNKELFKKPQNALETDGRQRVDAPPLVPEELCTKCPGCKALLFEEELRANDRQCPYCGIYFRMSARERVGLIVDEGTFEERFADIEGGDPLKFPGYQDKLRKARSASGEKEAVVCGFASVSGMRVAVFAMDPEFMLGSMGTALGEKVSLIFEAAAREGLPVVGFTVSGGARMQEGILSLMQMAKTSGSVGLHSQGGNLYICVLTDPTTGGVTASFAMQADIILAEPGALIGFAGPRVIEQTIRQTLPAGFQRAEFLLEKGFVDAIVERAQLKATIAGLLALHEKGVRA